MRVIFNFNHILLKILILSDGKILRFRGLLQIDFKRNFEN